MVFKGYATGTGKKATMKVKDAQLLSWDDVQGNQSFGAIMIRTLLIFHLILMNCHRSFGTWQKRTIGIV